MKFLSRAGSALLALFVARAISSPLVVSPGGAKDIVVNQDDTVNATNHYRLPVVVESSSSSSAGQLNLSLVNNLASTSVNAYVTGLDVNGQLVMLQPNGSWFYPTATNSGIPQPVTANVSIALGGQGSTTQVTLPGFISAGRVWFADGTLQFFTVQGGDGPSLVEPSAVNPSDPSANVNWGFVELTNDKNQGLYANISYVDFVGLPLGMTLTTTGGVNQSAQGVASDAVAGICKALIAQASVDGQPWDELCVTNLNGVPLRVLSPTQYLSINSSAFNQYWTGYINQVWSHYNTTPLTIDTQAAAGLVNCTTNNVTLTCAGDNRGYAKPTASDLFGCSSGTFAFQSGDNGVHYAVVPRLCAAFHRTSLLINGGNVQPSLNSSFYYTGTPTNWYSKVVHTFEIDSKGYAFSYDDVTPSGGTDQSGLLANPNPQLLAITVGGPLSGTTTSPIASPPAASPGPASVKSGSTSITSSSSSTTAVATTSTSPSTNVVSSTTTSAALTTSSGAGGRLTSSSSTTTVKTSSQRTAKASTSTVIKTTAKTAQATIKKTSAAISSKKSSSQSTPIKVVSKTTSSKATSKQSSPVKAASKTTSSKVTSKQSSQIKVASKTSSIKAASKQTSSKKTSAKPAATKKSSSQKSPTMTAPQKSSNAAVQKNASHKTSTKKAASSVVQVKHSTKHKSEAAVHKSPTPSTHKPSSKVSTKKVVSKTATHKG